MKLDKRKKSIVSVDNSKAQEGRRSAVISIPEQAPKQLYYESYEGELSTAAADDAFVLASLLLLMEAGHDVHVEGRVTSKLLMNLSDLQMVWKRWRPSKYHVIKITADEVLCHTPKNSHAISAFTGGVDASYTVYDVERNSAFIDLRAVMFVHGFDIPLHNERDYLAARRRGETMLTNLNLDSLGLKTNIRTLGQSWGDSFGLAVASCLALYQDAFSIGLIGSSEPYDELVLPWGSTPMTDHLCTTGMMEMRHHGAGASRTEKVHALSQWPAAVDNLRVCWQGTRGDVNCGRCEKCIRTFLNFKAVGTNQLYCFESIPSRAAVRNMRVTSLPQLTELKSILSFAHKQKIRESWVYDLRIAIAINNLRVRARNQKALLRTVQSLKNYKTYSYLTKTRGRSESCSLGLD